MSPDGIGGEPGWKPLLRGDLDRIATRLGVPPQVIEKDYILSYLLAGIADVPELHGLRFKGGTALKKVYFGDYRFSEDLDFSAVDAPHGPQMHWAIGLALEAARVRLAERGRFQLEYDRPPEREPHPADQDAFRVRFAFPWQNAPMVRVKVEITHDEPILLPASNLRILHGYEELGEHLDGVLVSTYTLEEIVAEKLRALRQTQDRLEGRGWSRPRARDYYDLWRILSEQPDRVDPGLVRRILPRKLAHRGVTYEVVEDFFTPELTREARIHWRTNLGTFVATLPDVDVVLSTLYELVHGLLTATRGGS